MAASLILDTIVHLGATRAEAAKAMKISEAPLNDIILLKKEVSANFALRLQFYSDIPRESLIHLQSEFDF